MLEVSYCYFSHIRYKAFVKRKNPVSGPDQEATLLPNELLELPDQLRVLLLHYYRVFIIVITPAHTTHHPHPHTTKPAPPHTPLDMFVYVCTTHTTPHHHTPHPPSNACWYVTTITSSAFGVRYFTFIIYILVSSYVFEKKIKFLLWPLTVSQSMVHGFCCHTTWNIKAMHTNSC